MTLVRRFSGRGRVEGWAGLRSRTGAAEPRDCAAAGVPPLRRRPGFRTGPVSCRRRQPGLRDFPEPDRPRRPSPGRRPPNSPARRRFKRNDQRNWFDPGNDCQKVANITSRADSAELDQRAGSGTAAAASATRAPARGKNTPRGRQHANPDTRRPYRRPDAVAPPGAATRSPARSRPSAAVEAREAALAPARRRRARATHRRHRVRRRSMSSSPFSGPHWAIAEPAPPPRVCLRKAPAESPRTAPVRRRGAPWRTAE